MFEIDYDYFEDSFDNEYSDKSKKFLDSLDIENKNGYFDLKVNLPDGETNIYKLRLIVNANYLLMYKCPHCGYVISYYMYDVISKYSEDNRRKLETSCKYIFEKIVQHQEKCFPLLDNKKAIQVLLKNDQSDVAKAIAVLVKVIMEKK
jgi:hypothetical protein